MIFLSFLLVAFLCSARASAQTLVLHHSDGSTTDIALYTEPSVKFTAEKVLVTSSVLNIEYDIDDILRFTYKGEETDFDSPKSDGGYTREHDRIVFHDLKSTHDVNVVTLKGHRLAVRLILSGTDVVLPLSETPSGMFLITVSGKTFKVMKP